MYSGGGAIFVEALPVAGTTGTAWRRDCGEGVGFWLGESPFCRNVS